MSYADPTLDELAAILDDHAAGAHDPPCCRYAHQAASGRPRSLRCGGEIVVALWPDGESWPLCAVHVESGARYLHAATLAPWIAEPSCPECVT